MYILTSLTVRVALFAEGGLDLRCGSPHLVHPPGHKPARATFVQVSVNCSHLHKAFLCAQRKLLGWGQPECLILHYIAEFTLLTEVNSFFGVK